MANMSLEILHFNDVYNINEINHSGGGAARFAAAIKTYDKDNTCMRLFSGDIFNPSMMSSVVKGAQMIPVLEKLKVQCAVFGNHDFDFGIDHLATLTEKLAFPWLMSNALDNVTNSPLADGLQYCVMDHRGVKVGLMGLIEHEWIDTLSTIDIEDVTFIDYVLQADLLSAELRSQGVDIVIALTHMRWPNDRRLATEAKDLDIILGGHDHDYGVEVINGCHIVKSGSDFRQFSKVDLKRDDKGSWKVKIERVDVNDKYEEDVEVKAIVDDYIKIVDSKMNTLLGEMEVDLEGRFAKVRTQETNLGNFIADIMLKTVDADIALYNSGTLRSDTLHKAGPFRTSTLLSILPMLDPVVVLAITGAQVLKALENSVCKYPTLEGRFAQVAGIRFAFDPKLLPSQRILNDSVIVQGEPIKLDKTYRICTKNYLAHGRDGYNVFKECPVLLNDEEGPLLSTCVINHFNSVKSLMDRKSSIHCHRHSIVPVVRRNSIKRELFAEEEESCDVLVDKDGVVKQKRVLQRQNSFSTETIISSTVIVPSNKQIDSTPSQVANTTNDQSITPTDGNTKSTHSVTKSKSHTSKDITLSSHGPTSIQSINTTTLLGPTSCPVLSPILSESSMASASHSRRLISTKSTWIEPDPAVTTFRHNTLNSLRIRKRMTLKYSGCKDSKLCDQCSTENHAPDAAIKNLNEPTSPVISSSDTAVKKLNEPTFPVISSHGIAVNKISDTNALSNSKPSVSVKKSSNLTSSVNNPSEVTDKKNNYPLPPSNNPSSSTLDMELNCAITTNIEPPSSNSQSLESLAITPTPSVLQHRRRSSAAVLFRRQSIDAAERSELSGALSPKIDGRITIVVHPDQQ